MWTICSPYFPLILKLILCVVVISRYCRRQLAKVHVSSKSRWKCFRDFLPICEFDFPFFLRILCPVAIRLCIRRNSAVHLRRKIICGVLLWPAFWLQLHYKWEFCNNRRNVGSHKFHFREAESNVRALTTELSYRVTRRTLLRKSLVRCCWAIQCPLLCFPIGFLRRRQTVPNK